MQKKHSEIVVIRKPLVDIYLVESYKAYNYLNTDRSESERMADGSLADSPGYGLL